MNSNINDFAVVGDVVYGFRLLKKEFVASKYADFYTLRHEKTGAELFYFDRADDNKTFSVSFKTLPEDNTGVFHILEHCVLNGSEKYPAKEPFVSMLQSSMQTFLNAMTYGDKTVFPVSSRNERDFFNLMSVYLDAVFSPAIYEKPEIFMQEGWHYEFDENGKPYYNGVVFSEMKGAFSDVDGLIYDNSTKLLFPDNSYGFTSGGNPDYITDLTYEQFINTHKRFYHPTNAKFFLDGKMDIKSVLKYIDGEYLSKYDYKEPDFDFSEQIPKANEETIYYEAREGEEEFSHISIAKILCKFDDVEKTYAAEILADYLAGSNEAPLKRALLEKGFARDVELDIYTGVYQPSVSLVLKNVKSESFGEIKKFIAAKTVALAKNGLDKKALSAALENYAFINKEISEPYGLELAIKALDGCLYGGDPLTHIDNENVFASLRQKINTDYFEKLLVEMLGCEDDKVYLYVLPSLTKGKADAEREAQRVAERTASWGDEEFKLMREKFEIMKEWQQSTDSDEVLAMLPHLDLKDVPESVNLPKTEKTTIGNCDVLKVETQTNGIVYLKLFFDISDFSVEELRTANAFAICFGKLRTENFTADELQTEIKATLGSVSAKIELTAKSGDLKNCKPYFAVYASMLEEKSTEAEKLVEEILLRSVFDETDKINETLLQKDYTLKQSLIGNGHIFALNKALSAFSVKGALKELLEGESYNNWFAEFSKGFKENETEYAKAIEKIAKKIFAGNRLFVGFCGELEKNVIENIIKGLPENEIGEPAKYPEFDREDCKVEIPASVGYSAMGHNIYALGEKFSGSCSVLSKVMSYAYLWNAVRVQGGAYGTGMTIRDSGDIFCYSYRDPNTQNSKNAFCGVADFLEEFASQGGALDDTIIGTVNTTEPLLEPTEVCDTECIRYLNGTTHEKIQQTRREILHTTYEDLLKFSKMLKKYAENGKFCAIEGKK